MKKKRVSIKDIAELAGVSHPTVSRALRGQGRMSEETRARILSIAQELDYTPSLVARGLVTQRSFSIGLVVTNFADPFHTDIAQGIEEEAIRNAYSLFLASTAEDPEREIEVVKSFQGRQVDGIIVSSSSVGNRYADLLQETGIPIVLVNAQARGDNLHTVIHDDYGGMTLLVEHTLSRGYRRIAYLGRGREGLAETYRQQAWSNTLSSHDVPPHIVAYGPDNGFECGYTGAQRIVRYAHENDMLLPDAICCYNDTMAIGALSFLHEQGFHVPTDIAVTGFDDIAMAPYTQPPLTTLRQPRHSMGIQAMKVMLDLINGNTNHQAPTETIVLGELVVRRST